MIVAVTGAAGHLGANLVRALLARGDGVRALVRRDARALSGLDVAVARGDARDRSALGSLLDGAERAFHLAATVSIDPRNDREVVANNVEGARSVADACLERGIRLVHFSSIHALTSREGPIDETASLALDHPFGYDRSKARAERAVLERVERGLDAVIVSPTAVIGPFDFRPSAVGRMLARLARKRLPCLVDGGFDWVDARDVASGAIAAAERGRSGERYLLGGSWRELRELAAIACAEVGVKAPRLHVPIGVARLAVPLASLLARASGTEPLFTARALEALRHHRDVRHDKAARELGHRPRPLEETVRDTCAWLAEAGLL